MAGGYNLQGIVRKNTVNALTQFEKFGFQSQNVSNYSTNGYKATRFEEVMGENGYTQGVIRTDHSQGSILLTKAELDVALNGPGFIPVTTPSGEIYYTRDGSFCIGKEGTLMTKMGDVVGTGIKIDADTVKVRIDKNGDLYTYKDLTKEPEFKGNIPVVVFDNPEGLKEIGGNKFAKTEISGEEQLVVDHTKITQYHIERSNVDLFDHVNMIMRTNAALLSSTSLIKVVNKMYDEAIDLR